VIGKTQIMNKFTAISTKDYSPLSYKEEYFHDKYELIQSFISKNIGKDFSDILAIPVIKEREVEWYTKSERKFKRVSEYPKSEQNKILSLYWKRMKRINELSASFSSSNSYDKKRWAELVNEVFNSNNNIVFSDGENIVLLWGWKFNALEENYVPPLIISSVGESKKPVTPEPIDPTISDPISVRTPDIEDELPETFVTKAPWHISFWQWLKRMFRRFWWLLLLLLVLWFILNLDSCSSTKSEHSSSPHTNPQETHNIIYDNDPNNQPNNWDPDNNNTGLPEDEFRQIVENNLPQELYKNLLTDENGAPRDLPNKQQVQIPFNPDNLIEDENSHQMIVPDRINIYLKNKNDKIEEFAIQFKEEFPSSDYQIIYRDDKIRRIQIKVPESEREGIKKKIKNNLNSNVLIWDETIFQGSGFRFNDPDLKNTDRNYYFKNINMSDSWKITTGDKDIIIAVIDDGFDLNHDELNDNIVKPYNVLYQNDKVYANSELNHGTHVAGLAISEKNNGKGVCGIAPDCSFMPIQIANTGGGFTSSSIIDGVLYAINNGADVINLSIQVMFPEGLEVTNRQFDEMQGSDDELFWNELFEIAKDSNITIVFCAGNREVLVGLDAMKRYDNIITVSATDMNNKKAKFSNYGKKSTISAPGVKIWSCKPGGDFTMMDGTSMSSPIIAGVVGLMKSVDPDLTNQEIIEILQETGSPVEGGVGPLVQVDKALSRCNGFNIIKVNELNTDSIRNEIKTLENRIIKLEKLLE
jgi:subtilisin family serine protease